MLISQLCRYYPGLDPMKIGVMPITTFMMMVEQMSEEIDRSQGIVRLDRLTTEEALGVMKEAGIG